MIMINVISIWFPWHGDDLLSFWSRGWSGFVIPTYCTLDF